MSAATIPILPSADLDQTAGFYGGLGFVERGRWTAEYLILERPDGIELHFWSNPDVDPDTNDVACYVRFHTAAEAQALHDGWAQAGVERGRLVAPKETDYGLLEFALIDPSGNLVRIGGSLGA